MRHGHVFMRWALSLFALYSWWGSLQTARAQLVFQSSVFIPTSTGQEFHPFALYAGQEPVDELEEVRQQFGLDRTWRESILTQVCAQPRVQCTRNVPVVYVTRITDTQGHVLGVLEIHEGQEPVDVIAAFAIKHQIQRAFRQQLLQAVCQQKHVRCTRTRSLIFEQRIHDEHGETIGKLDIYDDTEPIDLLYRFVKEHELPDTALEQLFQMICARIPCERAEPFIFSRVIADPDNSPIGELQIPRHREPADVVYAFCHHHGLDKAFRKQLMHLVCNDPHVACERMAPYVFNSPIVLENGTDVGALRIQEDEELADAVYHFSKSSKISPDLRFALLQQLCGREGILCTRSQALLRSIPISAQDGGTLGVISVYEGQEPADVVYAFAEKHGLSADDAYNLVDVLCGISKTNPPRPGEEPLTCTRYAPVVFAIPISAQNGSRLGVLEILRDDEPADAIARFGNKHGLGKPEKANLWDPICEASGLTCTRDVGLMYQAVYTLPDGRRERLDFLDGEEPTDVIYHYGLMRNLSFVERKHFLIEVCNEPRKRPNCTRAEPMLLSIPVWESADKKMGDLEILEGQEPIDQVYAFLEKHDLFQTEPLNTTLLEVVCNSTRVTCARKRPRRILFSMYATYAGISHSLQYVQPESDWICTSHHGGQRCVHYAEVLSKQFCETHMTDWVGCFPRILEALRVQLEFYEERMWRGKDLYAKLGLVKTASKEEIDVAYNRLVKRFNNETEPQKYEKLQEAYRTLSDPEEKYFYDLPCMKLFGLCGKKKKDGSISITPDN
ncbi:hypothetical protein Poli38472_006151 [Pythium oligandrum]|uniref:J domain-containing protein n=1 Tax=Pythium oligandrum TaxID=41045 RepID=A0A8K1FSL8_PYTOL|nr:hypothetical protein Poli38472_006151 [Pythium oligandrum]|eukprot:TMW68683.1 hypothetical protein Poli38472_006151 [Pythium oligandrum]